MRLYRALLRAYPRSFRAEYGRDMEAIFRARRRDASGLGLVTLWCEVMADVAVNATRVHLDQLSLDLRDATRALSHARGFTFTAILVAALGVGATSTAFSVADHVLVRPLPFPDPHRLVMAWQDQSARGYSRMELSVGNYVDWKSRATSFEGFAAFTSTPVNLIGQGSPERLDAAVVTPDTFSILGVPALLGRSLVASDAAEQGEPAVVLSDSLWRSKFAAGDVLGRTVNLDGMPHVVVGVMPSAFQFPTRDIDVWIPFRLVPDDDRANTYLRTVGRLRPGVTLDQARSELRVIAAQLEREHPDANRATSATLHLLRDQVAIASAPPTTTPDAASVRPRPTTIRTISPGRAPRAMRMPMSRVRLATANESSPCTPTAASTNATIAKPATTRSCARRPDVSSATIALNSRTSDTGCSGSTLAMTLRTAGTSVSGGTLARTTRSFGA